MKGSYRTRSRLVLDLLAAIEREGPIGVTRLLLVANLTHAKLHELLASFEERGWVESQRDAERIQYSLTSLGARVLEDLRRVDAVQDYGLGL